MQRISLENNFELYCTVCSVLVNISLLLLLFFYSNSRYRLRSIQNIEGKKKLNCQLNKQIVGVVAVVVVVVIVVVDSQCLLRILPLLPLLFPSRLLRPLPLREPLRGRWRPLLVQQLVAARGGHLAGIGGRRVQKSDRRRRPRFRRLGAFLGKRKNRSF